VSEDKEKWASAKDVPELQMQWMVKLVNGESYGPVNVFAVQYLINDGVVAADAELTNRTGETISADKLLSPEVAAIMDENMRLTRQMKEKDGLLRAERERTLKQQQELATAKAASVQRSTAAPPPKTIRHQLMKQPPGTRN